MKDRRNTNQEQQKIGHPLHNNFPKGGDDDGEFIYKYIHIHSYLRKQNIKVVEFCMS